MFLREFTDNSLAVRLSSVVRQLKARRDDTAAKEPMSVRSFINHLRDNDLYVTKEDLIDMIKNPPLKNIIHNIKGDRVVFKGDSSTDADQPSDDTEDTLDTMSRRAAGL